MGEEPSADEFAQRGRERRAAADRRAAEAHERAEQAHEHARSAETADIAELHEREAALHEHAVKVHAAAAEIQRRHEEEHADDGRDEGEPGSGG